MGQAIDVDDIMDGKSQCQHAEQDVTVENMRGYLGGMMQDNGAATHEQGKQVDDNEDDGRCGIVPHAPPLQVTGHADT